MSTILCAELQPQTLLKMAGVILADSETGKPLFGLTIHSVGYQKITEADALRVAQYVIAAINDQDRDPLDVEARERVAQPPSWIAPPPGESRVHVPSNAQRDSTGELIVPSRRKDETAEEKRIRRALRRARRKEREAKGLA